MALVLMEKNDTDCSGDDEILYFYVIFPSAWHYTLLPFCQSWKAKKSYHLKLTTFWVRYVYESVGDVTVDLYLDGGDDLPTGSILASGTLTPTAHRRWQGVDWGDGYALSKDVRYCYVLRLRDVHHGFAAYVALSLNRDIYEDGALNLGYTFRHSPIPDALPELWHPPYDGRAWDALFRNYADQEGLSGTIAGVSSLSGIIVEEQIIKCTYFSFARQTDPTKPNYYNPDLFWLPGEWVGDTYIPPKLGNIGESTYLPLGGGRWQDPLVAIGNNKVYVEDFY